MIAETTRSVGSDGARKRTAAEVPNQAGHKLSRGPTLQSRRPRKNVAVALAVQLSAACILSLASATASAAPNPPEVTPSTARPEAALTSTRAQSSSLGAIGSPCGPCPAGQVGTVQFEDFDCTEFPPGKMPEAEEVL